MAKEKEKVLSPTEKPDIEAVQKEMARILQENKFLNEKLKEAAREIEFLSIGEVHKRLEWLWRVITLPNAAGIFGPEFYHNCIANYKEIMTPVQVESEKR